MDIGKRLRKLREERKFSQGDMEKSTGLFRCYISRVENGYTVPNLKTLEKCAKAFDIPLFRLFYEGDEPLALSKLPRRSRLDELAEGRSAKESDFLGKLFKSLGRLTPTDRNLFLNVAQKLAGR